MSNAEHFLCIKRLALATMLFSNSCIYLLNLSVHVYNYCIICHVLLTFYSICSHSIFCSCYCWIKLVFFRSCLQHLWPKCFERSMHYGPSRCGRLAVFWCVLIDLWCRWKKETTFSINLYVNLNGITTSTYRRKTSCRPLT